MSIPIPGLFYYSSAITHDLASRLATFLDTECALFGVPGRGGVVSPDARRVAHYGHRYDYTSGRTSTPADPFPAIIDELCTTIRSTHPSLPADYTFDQCIINRYLPGQGIGAHYDREEYGEVIACFTLGSGAEMEFTERDGDGKFCVYTEPMSLYIMSGPSRHDWLHQMRPRRKDPGHGLRGTRWSITFRLVRV